MIKRLKRRYTLKLLFLNKVNYVDMKNLWGVSSLFLPLAGLIISYIY
jgi:hypothetical protein